MNDAPMRASSGDSSRATAAPMDSQTKIEELAAAGVRAVALVFVDNAGIARMKCVPLDRLEQAAASGVGIAPIFGVALGNDHFASMPGLDSPSGDIRLVADLRSAAALAPAPGWAWAPVDQRDQEGRAWPGCQRTFLQRMIERAAGLGISLMCGYEMEWTVAHATSQGVEPIYSGPGYGAAALGALGDYMLNLVDAATLAEIGIDQVHPEYSAGQVEVSLSPGNPLQATDQSLLFRQIARSLADRCGWRASFSPAVSNELLGNGAHVHFSVWRDGANQFAGGTGPAGLQPEGQSFLAGVLSHLPALTALGAPTAISYVRLQPSHWAGAYACWGQENREAALRLEAAIGPHAHRSANVEWKSVDMAANPYLVLGGIIAAGVDGVERQLCLPPPVAVDPAVLSEEERQSGAITRLPASLAEATDSLCGSTLLREAMGAFLFDSVVAVRRAEVADAASTDTEALYVSHRWRY